MDRRSRRLARLVEIQRQLKAVHEMRHAALTQAAHAAGAEAREVMARKSADDSLASLFPDIYERRIAGALATEASKTAEARIEAVRVAEETARENTVERQRRDAARVEERHDMERELLETIEKLRMMPR